MTTLYLSQQSITFRANLAELVAPLRRVRSRSPFFHLAAHRIPTLWSLYRGLLRNSPTGDIKFRVTALFRKYQHLTGTGETRKHLRQGYKWLEFFAKAKQGDAHCQAVLSRYSRLIAAKRENAFMLGLLHKELEWQERLRNRPILTGGFLRPTIYNGPLPRMKPQPIAISGMIRTRMKARTVRLEKQSRMKEALDDLASERRFEMGLKQLVGEELSSTFYSDLDAYEQWTAPIKRVLQDMDKVYKNDHARSNRPYPPELLESIIEARREKIRNKTREKERERSGEILKTTLRRQQQGPPAHILAKMSPERRKMDKVARSLSEVGYVALVKRRLKMPLKDPEAGLESGEKRNRPLLDDAARMLNDENTRRAEDERKSVEDPTSNSEFLERGIENPSKYQLLQSIS
ncbi:hypothetical protein B0H34DRAFT_667715 [Crassisporium funariophilum]|nr:hypothetical protein B0H34DRAFT_667715 [Crassisporium funariophilum]